MEVLRCLDVALGMSWKGKWMKQDTVTKEADHEKAIAGFSDLHT